MKQHKQKNLERCIRQHLLDADKQTGNKIRPIIDQVHKQVHEQVDPKVRNKAIKVLLDKKNHTDHVREEIHQGVRQKRDGSKAS